MRRLIDFSGREVAVLLGVATLFDIAMKDLHEVFGGPSFSRVDL